MTPCTAVPVMSAVKNGYKRWIVPRTQRVPSPHGTCTSSVLQKKVPGCPAGNPLMYRLAIACESGRTWT